MARGKPGRQHLEVILDAPELGPQRRLGILHRPLARSGLPASFEYDPEWLASDRAFQLDPRLELWTGEQHPPAKASAFGIFLDSAPDRWGRVLLERREAAVATREHRPARTLEELDFLLGVHDETRAGALRFRSSAGGPFLDDSETPVPPVASLRELAAVSARLEEPGAEKLREYERWLALLIAPGTSLGGARPKANFTDGGRLWIAKFPAREDRYDVGCWEALAHRLAKAAGVTVPESRLEALGGGYRTFCAVRFDRAGAGRRMFASAMTLLERRDGDPEASYLDLAEFISSHGASGRVEEDLHQLYRRVAFNVLIGNRDDHLRNHGFIREAAGWRLSPAYDLNPNPWKAEHALTLDGATAAGDPAVVLHTAELYRLKQRAAKTILEEVRVAVGRWRREAARLGCPRDEIVRMENVIRA